MIRFRYKILLFFSILSAQSTYAVDTTKGLYFSSYEVTKENRTSLHVPVPKTISLYDGFSMNFEIKIRNELQNFGYIFQMIGKNNTCLALVVSDLRVTDKTVLSLIIGDKVLITFKRQEIADFQFEAWSRVTISFSKNGISMVVNGVKKEYTDDYDNINKFDIYFGANNHPTLFTTETPPMIIKNIHLFNKNKEIRCWTLDKHSTNIVYDEYKKEAAFVLNPKWELDSHLIWKKQKEINFAPYPQIAFDGEQERIFITSGNEMMIYHIQSNTLDTIRNIQGTAYKHRTTHTLYDNNNRTLISYILAEHLSDNQLTEFDFRLNKWNNTDNKEQKPYYWHHGKVFIPEDSLLVTVGGYGFHQYKGVLMKYAFADKKWQEVTISPAISPRYLGSTGYLGDGKLLYFGGYGSESGDQEKHPGNYYDLYEIDLFTDSITKLWNMELPVNEAHFTNSNSMIIDKENDSFYVLTYSNRLDKTKIQAKKFRLSFPQYTLVGDTIPYIFSDIKSYCDLFHCTQSNLLVAVTVHTKEDDTGEVNIYTINYPPLNSVDVFQAEHKRPIPIYWYVLAALLLPVLFLCRRKWEQRKKKKPVDFTQDTITSDENNDESVPVEVQASSINLLGEFYVIDDSGVDITGNFKPITTQLFLLCLLSSIKNGKGISSRELKDILWFDKDDDSAQNNRNVNVSKLRLTLKNLKNFKINIDNSFWTVTFDKTVFCDYKHVLSLIKKIESEETVRKELLNKLLSIASKGVLLPNIQAEWLDGYKAEYSNLIIEKLLQFSEKEDIKRDFSLVIKMANVILLHDHIDEDAIVKKCYALYHSGKKGQAKQSFKKFTEDYKNILGTDYKYTFEQFSEKYL
jgi:DNA-binding SARP family transcriptional activator